MLYGISLDAAASPGAGVAIAFDVPKTAASMQVTTTGSPSTMSVVMEGSLDGINFFTLAQASNPAGEVVWVGGDSGSSPGGGPMPAILYLRANLASLSGGVSPTVTAVIAGA